jgi:hypothetical protein
MSFETPSPDIDVKKLNPNKGVLYLATYWRPRPDDPDPDMPGEKIQITSYLPLTDKDDCPCGSGKLYRVCCRRKSQWPLFCPNPGLTGYSLLRPQTAIFTEIDGMTLGPKLMDEERLYCVENTLKRAFWLYWGTPALQAAYGMCSFGDLELIEAHTLIVTAMSDYRMQVMRNLLKSIAGDTLGNPQIERESVKHIPKR